MNMPRHTRRQLNRIKISNEVTTKPSQEIASEGQLPRQCSGRKKSVSEVAGN